MNDASSGLVAEGLVKTYEQGRVRALDGVNLEVASGEFVCVVGTSGSGKSTLMHMLGALDVPDEGRIVIDGRSVDRRADLVSIRRRSIGFVFQLHNLMPTLTALENVEVPLRPTSMRARQRRQRATDLLNRVGMSDRLTHRPNKLSGGERQRVAIARALVNQPRILLADEPTGNLDQVSSKRILDLLLQLHVERGLTIVLVTHDQDIACRAQRTVTMRDGKLE